MKNILKACVVFAILAVVLVAAKMVDNAQNQKTKEIAMEYEGPSVTQATVPETEPAETEAPTEPTETEPAEKRFVISFAGDCTLGSQESYFQSKRGFVLTVEEKYDYPFKSVKKYFEKDDLTIVNLEGVLFDDTSVRTTNLSAMRGKEAYTEILVNGSIEAVTLANDHAQDYGDAGYTTTKKLLDEKKIAYAEKNSSTVITLEGGLVVGIYATADESADAKTVEAGIKELKEKNVDLIIYAPHWGNEKSNAVDKKQPELAHAAINAGAHIVYGTNPRVLLPIEEYNGGVIFYSLGRFCYGNDTFPIDYDTAIIQQEIVLSKDGTMTMGERKIIPCSVSSSVKKNTYKPTPYKADSDEYKRVLTKLGADK